MSYFASIGQERHSRGLRALGLFVAVWLNLAMQPCAMAYQAEDDHDCPHCPPAAAHDHGDRHGGSDGPMPCADGAADCMIDDDWSHDGRGGSSKLKDASGDSPVAIIHHEYARTTLQHRDTTLRPRTLSVHAGVPPPLHVLYCVYLD